MAAPEIDEDLVDAIGGLEAFLYPDNPLIEIVVLVRVDLGRRVGEELATILPSDHKQLARRR
ncbi:hypothetical protein [Streptomyces nojiriensis]|uniref:hypothetical protein n=1 Tax=Streptomyces nojiriensis TaxID=66374 RepID=UPI0036527CB2